MKSEPRSEELPTFCFLLSLILRYYEIDNLNLSKSKDKESTDFILNNEVILQTL